MRLALEILAAIVGLLVLCVLGLIAVLRIVVEELFPDD